MRNRTQEKLLKISIFILTLVMIVLRFLLNEKGRTNPDSIRFMRTSKLFPEIDNTTTPLGYPLSLKFFTFFGFDEFWASKLIGILAYLFIIIFAWKKKFYFKETLLLGGIFSFVSIFSYTMSESLILPFMFLFLYVSRQIIIGEFKGFKAFLYLSLSLLALYNIRYPALFIIGGVFLFGILNYRKSHGKSFIYSSFVGFAYIVLYKFLFIDYFNDDYIDEFLEIGLHPTSKLLIELVQGMATTFNPFIHIANPAGGIINFGIYGIGLLNILLMCFIFIKNKLSETERFFVFVGSIGIICSFFIQYFYSVNPIDYRLMAPFSFPIWLVYFKKMYQIFGKLTYGITILSLMTGFVFTWLSRGNYLENRREITKFLNSEKLEEGRVYFFMEDDKMLDKMQIAELISTVNPNVKVTFNPKDTIRRNTLTKFKVLRKIKIDENKYQ
ncbi:hypothetical protein [Kaistella montana]|uniref:Glycosyltransferase RgtA/B/C/D-like domain-containing protein n=1 Tax=Kaistella montana TaxID=1849733 RepID=A0ABW5K658_9FLAO|nr:hypothetical protein [Kaistella montana]MCQ4034618.1 hypothetical protein [Kaistella montana]